MPATGIDSDVETEVGIELLAEVQGGGGALILGFRGHSPDTVLFESILGDLDVLGISVVPNNNLGLVEIDDVEVSVRGSILNLGNKDGVVLIKLVRCSQRSRCWGATSQRR